MPSNRQIASRMMSVASLRSPGGRKGRRAPLPTGSKPQRHPFERSLEGCSIVDDPLTFPSHCGDGFLKASLGNRNFATCLRLEIVQAVGLHGDYLANQLVRILQAVRIGQHRYAPLVNFEVSILQRADFSSLFVDTQKARDPFNLLLFEGGKELMNEWRPSIHRAPYRFPNAEDDVDVAALKWISHDDNGMGGLGKNEWPNAYALPA